MNENIKQKCLIKQIYDHKRKRHHQIQNMYKKMLRDQTITANRKTIYRSKLIIFTMSASKNPDAMKNLKKN